MLSCKAENRQKKEDKTGLQNCVVAGGHWDDNYSEVQLYAVNYDTVLGHSG